MFLWSLHKIRLLYLLCDWPCRQPPSDNVTMLAMSAVTTVRLALVRSLLHSLESRQAAYSTATTALEMQPYTWCCPGTDVWISIQSTTFKQETAPGMWSAVEPLDAIETSTRVSDVEEGYKNTDLFAVSETNIQPTEDDLVGPFNYIAGVQWFLW